MKLIWATRGRTWGFRFLLDGGFADPLIVRDQVFAGLEDDPEVWRRVGDSIALRFPDPEGRRDASGRVIPHEFVIVGPETREIHSLADGRALAWPQVASMFDRIWRREEPNCQH